MDAAIYEWDYETALAVLKTGFRLDRDQACRIFRTAEIFNEGGKTEEQDRWKTLCKKQGFTDE